MKIIPIPVLEDNYSYICIDDKTKEAAVIDPVEPIKILNVLSQTGAKLSRYFFNNKPHTLATEGYVYFAIGFLYILILSPVSLLRIITGIILEGT
jgi:hypothetical protein